jgi:glycosyltransferase involved in cell wall biosynthesis
MVKQINRLLNEPELYRTLVENGVRDVQQYSWQEIKQSWLGLYEAQRRC